MISPPEPQSEHPACDHRRPSSTSKVKASRRFRELGIFLTLTAMVVCLLVLAPGFRTVDNLINITRNFAFVGIVAMGMLLVMITGGIDLSVGSVWGATAVSTTSMLQAGWPSVVAIPLGLSIALGFGAFNGFCITRFRMPPFVPTLATLSIARGLALVITRGHPIFNYGPDGKTFLHIGAGNLLGVPNPVVIFAVIALSVWFFLKKTIWGRYIYAIGGNERAASLTGLRVSQLKMFVYLSSAFLAGLAGIVEASYLSSVTASLATGNELNVIAATVIGGTDLTGGQGTVPGVVIGTVILELLRNGLLLLGVDPYWQSVFVGLVIVVAVLVDNLRKGSRLRW